jgi:hypothetical protein
MGAPMRSNASRWALVGSASMGMVAGGAGEVDLVAGEGGQVGQEAAEAAVGPAVLVVLVCGLGLGLGGPGGGEHRVGGGTRHLESRLAGVRDGDLRRLAGWVARLGEGNRNDGLFWAACRAAETGRHDLLPGLADAARTAGLGDREITATIASARRHAEPHPEREGTP